MKKYLLILISIMVMFTFVNITIAQDSESISKVIEKGYLPPEDLGEMITRTSFQSSCSANINGRDLVFAASNNGYFSVLDVNARKIIASYKVENMASVWMHYVASDGMVYFGGNGCIDKYDPYRDRLYRLGNIAQYWCVQMTEDENGNLYYGTYPKGEIMKYEPKTGAVTNLGRIDENASYADGIGYYKGYLYCSVRSGDSGWMAKVNVNDFNDKKKIFSPEGYTNGGNGYYRVAGDLLFMNQGSPIAYDMEKDEFVDLGLKGQNISGTFSSVYNGKVYFACGIWGKHIDMYTVDIKTREVKPCNWNLLTMGFGNYSSNTFVTIDEATDPEMAGVCLVHVGNKNPLFINIETGKSKYWTDVEFQGAAVDMCAIANGEDNSIYVGGDRVAAISRYDINTGEKKQLTSTNQTEAIAYSNGLMYLGTYPDTGISIYDPKNPVLPDGKNHKMIYNVVNDLKTKKVFNRTQNMVVGEDKVFFTEIPGYVDLGGGFGWVDTKKNNEIFFEEDLINNLSIKRIAYHNGIIYGATSIYGGTQVLPSESTAVIFAYDVANKKIIKKFTPTVPGITDPAIISGINVDKNGKIWVVIGYTLISVDFETEKVIDVYKFGEGGYKVSQEANYVSQINFDKDGLLYVYTNHNLRVVNVDTLTTWDVPYTNRYDTMGTGFVFDDDGNLYYLNKENLMRLPIVDFKVSEEEIKESRELFSDKIALKIGSPYVAYNGNVSLIDSNNLSITPKVENNRTLLPVRFISEALGMKVNWDNETETVTLSGKSFNATIKIGENEMTANDEKITLDVPAKVEDGRTLLPLRAISEAFSKEVFWDDSGIIIISNDQVKLDLKKIHLVDAYLNNIIKQDYSDYMYSVDRENEIKKNNGKVLNFKNGDFEQKIKFKKEPVPYWNLSIVPNGQTIKIETRTDKVFDGTKSLYIYNETKGAGTSYITASTGLLEVDSNKYNNYVITYKQFAISGDYFHRRFITYDENKNILNIMERYDVIQAGMWKSREFSFYVPDKRVKYVSFEMGCSAYYPVESYYDSFMIVGY